MLEQATPTAQPARYVVTCPEHGLVASFRTWDAAVRYAGDQQNPDMPGCHCYHVKVRDLLALDGEPQEWDVNGNITGWREVAPGVFEGVS